MRNAAVRLLIFFACAALGVVAVGQVSVQKSTDEEGNLARVIDEMCDALNRHNSSDLARALAADFTLQTSGGTLDRDAFIRAANSRDLLVLDRGSLVVKDEHATAEGRVTLRRASIVTTGETQGGAAEIQGTPVVAAQSTIVNFSELARQDAAKQDDGAEQHLAIHPPLSIEDDAPTEQFDYVAHFVRREGRWQLVRLELARRK